MESLWRINKTLQFKMSFCVSFPKFLQELLNKQEIDILHRVKLL